MSELISEPITPVRGTSDSAPMAAGLPGLPEGFVWRGKSFGISEVLEQWKQTSREGGRAGGQMYLRRHCYTLRMSDGSIWSVYFVRQTPKSGSPKTRWFLYTVGP